jgi:hypothetical protein
MNPKRILDSGLWKDLATETTWALSRESAVTEPTWPLPVGLRRKLRLRWPTDYRQPVDAKWLEPLRRGFQHWVDVERADLPQPDENILRCEAVSGDVVLPVAIDFADRDPIREDVAASVGLYFKLQYRAAGYGLKHVLPGGYVANDERVYRYLSRLRASADQKPPLYDVYGRFGAEFAQETRRRAIELLQAQERFAFEGGMVRMRYSRFLREVAVARVCIDLPGNGGFCFRLVDYLAVGACVIGPRHGNVLPTPLQDRVNIVYCRDDLSDLVDLCEHYLHRTEERRALVTASRDYFDRHLHRSQLAAWYLHHLVAKVG